MLLRKVEKSMGLIYRAPEVTDWAGGKDLPPFFDVVALLLKRVKMF